mmetsp:Transcript_42185/g.75561  ORF Transcript_42185/g.75561 Transcript_42185/m.75561 type:complete len:231 (-) Transcript_42185:44-736(-)
MPSFVVIACVGSLSMFLGDVVAQAIDCKYKRHVRYMPARPPEDRPPDRPEEVSARHMSPTAAVSCSPADWVRLWEVMRSLQMGLLGGLWVAPNNWGWYQLMQLLIPETRAQAGWKVLAVAVTQLVYAPWINATTLGLAIAFRTQSCNRALVKVRAELWTVLVRGCPVWTVEKLFNFLVVPLEWRVIIDQCTSFFWFTYLAWVSAQSLPGDMARDPEPCEVAEEPQIRPVN